MSEGHEPHEHAHAAPTVASFRFEAFADAAAAQAAFEALYALGSSIERALQALVGMGAQCKAVSPTRVACRYVEKEGGLARWCWHVALDCNSEKEIQRIRFALGVLAA
jgi:hypothetical protein